MQIAENAVCSCTFCGRGEPAVPLSCRLRWLEAARRAAFPAKAGRWHGVCENPDERAAKARKTYPQRQEVIAC
jgi:hypothetical protein